jgi:hypothetical protein
MGSVLPEWYAVYLTLTIGRDTVNVMLALWCLAGFVDADLPAQLLSTSYRRCFIVFRASTREPPTSAEMAARVDCGMNLSSRAAASAFRKAPHR